MHVICKFVQIICTYAEECMLKRFFLRVEQDQRIQRRTPVVAQWLRIHLPVEGTWVQSLAHGPSLVKKACMCLICLCKQYTCYRKNIFEILSRFLFPSQQGLLTASRRTGILWTRMHRAQVSYRFWLTTWHQEVKLCRHLDKIDFMERKKGVSKWQKLPF